MEENKFTNEENVTVDTEEVNADAVVEEIAEEAEAAVEEIAEEAEAAAEEAAEEAEAEEGFIEKLEAVVEEIAKEADEATEEIMRETKAAAEEFAGEAGAAADEFAEDAKAAANDIVAKIKALVKDGNVTYIRIRKDDTVVLNLPMTVGIIGTVLGLAAAPWVIIIATITTIGLKCTVEVEKKDGSIVIIHGKEKQ